MFKTAMNENIKLPLDIKLINGLSAGMIVLIIVLALIFLAKNLKTDIADLRGIVITGDSKYQNPSNIRDAILPNISGGIIDVNLVVVKSVFENLPWVRSATVKKVYPNRINVSLTEHLAVGVWGDSDEWKMVNAQGEIFEVGSDELEEFVRYPKFVGSDSQSVQIVNMYQKLKIMFSPMNTQISKIQLSPRGNWSILLDNGTHLELGRGSVEQIFENSKSALQTSVKIVEKYGKRVEDIKYLDLRYQDGYAIQMSGVSLIESPSSKHTINDK
ncbi:MAG: cell division protein FtsQ/DivIB [Polaromonas sp.]|jgi:cell division protein FtsQ|nr:cell division protein FtsQ/DivIB [Polaromonas sp.]MBK9340309.1 cell division protein FtsQ/DivIB [Rhodoferax sp.]MBP7115360.1 cell division protein FtsQ/DivIB [Polaromonas sp.]MBP9056975.1 cell division protein FtsQ/DivIB [Polaromonas sp.]MBP9830070.1 cell division protein FtsQ/DivIB [Polaromonas sp.]